MNTETIMRELPVNSEFYIGIDSDGCVFDSMNLKHDECFCPAFINHLDLQAVSTFAKEVWGFVNLYSRNRGINRYKALILVLDILRNRKAVKDRGVQIPGLTALREWISREPGLGLTSLESEIERVKNTSGDESTALSELQTVHSWSRDVNAAVEKIGRGVSPFPAALPALSAMSTRADMVVISQTPQRNIVRDWTEHGIIGLVNYIAGQEMGTKSMHLNYTAAGKYRSGKILMIGDAPGDHHAAEANDALFFPIIPGKEKNSWKELYENGLDRFFEGQYIGEYQNNLLEQFYESLPEHPDW